MIALMEKMKTVVSKSSRLECVFENNKKNVFSTIILWSGPNTYIKIPLNLSISCIEQCCCCVFVSLFVLELAK